MHVADIRPGNETVDAVDLEDGKHAEQKKKIDALG